MSVEPDSGQAGAAQNAKSPQAADTQVAFIYGRSANVFVFRDTEDHIQWDVKGDCLTPAQSRVHHRFDSLRIRIRQCLADAKQEMFRDRMAQALFHALEEQDEQRALAYFDSIDVEVQSEAQRDAQHQYLLYGSVAAGIIILSGVAVALLTDAIPRSLPLAAVTGAAGAWASVLQRVWTINLPPNETPSHLVLQGATRIALGVIFGITALAAVLAGLLVPAAESSPWAIGLVTFVAGWSERLVPEMMSKIEGQMRS